ncbi:hypothetical protein HP550_11000 [Cellulomonas humilata]|uniref:Uncharacterized protein n=1 Tax=Cellulomonas humilata TaxID=144055 RepID=A0A7Y6A2N4_9CELL|nr:hypothetical protein [Cellulomonas humilata]NUU17775.1 hypothetical protein [Cellulomonas humilata]
MPGADPHVVIQQLPTVLGPLELALPEGAALSADPGAVDGAAWYWVPQPGVAVLTVVDGDASLLTPTTLLDLERSLSDTTVEEVRDEPGQSDGERHLEFLSLPRAVRTFTTTVDGHQHPVRDTQLQGQQARFRFWQRGDHVVRLGFRLERAAEAEWRARLDQILDLARLP